MSPAWRSRIGRQIAAYLTLKKSLGRHFFSETYVFADLDRFLAKKRATALTPEIFVEWVGTFAHVSPTVRRTRMRIVAISASTFSVKTGVASSLIRRASQRRMNPGARTSSAGGRS
jgi:hypothetical protein